MKKLRNVNTTRVCCIRTHKKYVWKKMKLEKVIYRMYLSGVSLGFRYSVRARDN